jgi:hypothetical protein
MEEERKRFINGRKTKTKVESVSTRSGEKLGNNFPFNNVTPWNTFKRFHTS